MPALDGQSQELQRAATELDPAAMDRFVAALQGMRGIRVPELQIWRAFAQAFPRRPSGREERRWLLAALHLAADRGVLQLPAQGGRRWDRSGQPPLPLGIDLVRETTPPPDDSWRAMVWHHQLQWVPDLPRVSTADLQFLRRVHDGLVAGEFREPAPFLYRSLQLTGDEKRLKKLRKGKLFGPGRLSLELIGCQPVVPLLSWVTIGDSRRVLVFENAAPFDLAVRLLREKSEPPYGTVVYGAGTAFVSAVQRLTGLPIQPTEIAYVGDLDQNGIRIPLLAGIVARAAGLPAPIAAPRLHEAMIAGATALGHPLGWPPGGEGSEETEETGAGFQRNDEDSAGGEGMATMNDPGLDHSEDQLLAFLPASVRLAVRAMWSAGRRIPEEVLAPEALRTALMTPSSARDT